ncbi:thymidine kinase [Bacillus cereus]|uniref:thymidine kinase n=1 Tax=Bacillus cereus TaxID=1396 RepID=UPI000B4B4AFD|nr:thymidine kinase [Bacillus cereus]
MCGCISVISGPMFSEKSGELIKRCLKLEKYGRKKVKVYKPSKDNRFSTDKVVSRMGYEFPATNLPETLTDEIVDSILVEMMEYDVVGFDEVQFYNKNIMRLVSELADRGKEVIVAGLNMDYRAKEFGYIGGLMAMADEVEKLFAFCSVCGSPKGTHTQRMVNGKPARSGPIVVIGDTESYESRCRACYVSPKNA